MFFLPTYARYFRNSPRLRVIAAVFAAAFVGNMYYHLLQHKEPLVAGDWNKLWSLLGARLIYCVLLAGGIAISMLRQQHQRSRPHSGASRRVEQIAPSAPHRRASGLFSPSSIFGMSSLNLTIAERARLFFSLFGL